jgi:hypothetical protein
MNGAADRVKYRDRLRPYSGIRCDGEAVWWITIVNDTLRKLHRLSYDVAKGSQMSPVEGTIAGLRCVRHRIGHEIDLVDFVEPMRTGPTPPTDGSQRGGGRPFPRRRDRTSAISKRIAPTSGRSRARTSRAHYNAQHGVAATR